MKRLEGTVFLDYADPKDVGDVAVRGRHRIHRSCWQPWDLRESWFSSSFRLRSRAENPNEHYAEQVSIRATLATVTLTDFRLGFQIELRSDELDAFVLAIQTGDDFTWTHEGDVWQCTTTNNDVLIRAIQGTSRPDVVATASDTARWLVGLASIRI
jgi:hypothetical protein